MPIDRQRNIVFIHIPKTGGTSIEAMFRLSGVEHLLSPKPLPDLTPPNKTPQHFTWLELQLNVPRIFNERCQRGLSRLPGFVSSNSVLRKTCASLSAYKARSFLRHAYKFAFVRNPWDRFFSEFYWRRSWFPREWEKDKNLYYSPAHMADLDSFVKLLELPLDQRIDARKGFDGHLETQISFLRDAHGTVDLNFLGRFERFAEDVRKVGTDTGVNLQEVAHLRRSRRPRDYRPYYSNYARAAVESFYAEDIAEFRYTF